MSPSRRNVPSESIRTERHMGADLMPNSAILTKYETLRSFMKLKPASFSKLAYENAQMYTNTLLDVYMDYKNVCKTMETTFRA